MPRAKVLTLRFLGEVEVAKGREPLALPPSKKTRALLAYLAVTARPHRRERLCSLLWDVPDDPRGALRWSLSKLRALVDEPRRTRIVAEGDTVGFEPLGALVDVAELRQALARGTERVALADLERWSQQFRGDFLEGVELPGMHAFQAWCIAEREEARRLRAKLQRALIERLAEEPERALVHAQALVELEPFDEAAHADVVRLLLRLGRGREAAEHRDLAVHTLTELGFHPSAALRETATPSTIAAALRGDAGRKPAPARRVPGPRTSAPLAGRSQRRALASEVERTTRYARNGDVSIAYQVVGSGPIDLVLVPGWVSHVEYAWEEPAYARFLERLASFSRLILLDRRGTGLSDRDATIPTLEERMEDTRAVMDAAGCERAALFGISEGGPICMLFGATHPERTSALVLCNSASRWMYAPDYPAGWHERDLEQFLTYLQDWGTGRSVVLLAPSRADDQEFRTSWARFERFGVSPAGFQTLIRVAAATDARDILPTIAVPTLVVHRKDDRILPVALARYMAERIPGARYVELPGADHFAWVGNSDAILDEVEEFLTGVRSGKVERQLVTLLFTDIANSTARASLLGDRMWAELSARHDALVRGELERFRGSEIDHSGDGFLAGFDGPARAIRCGESLVVSARGLGLDLKVGIHTGECERHEGRVRGVAVHIGARVVAKAEPGEVLVTQTVRDLVAGSGIDFDSRGSHDLKGIPGAWSLYRVSGRVTHDAGV